METLVDTHPRGQDVLLGCQKELKIERVRYKLVGGD